MTGYTSNVFMHSTPIIKSSNNKDTTKYPLTPTQFHSPPKNCPHHLAYIIQERVLCIYICQNVHIKIHGFGFCV